MPVAYGSPRDKQYRKALQDDRNSIIVTTLLGQDKIYGEAGQAPDYDWQLPTPPKKRIRIDWNRKSDTQLIGQDIIYGSQGQSPDYDYPNPRINPKSRQSHTLATPNILFPDATVFSNLDWPLPTVKKRVLRLDQLASTEIWLIGQDIIYGAAGEAPAYDWQLPRINPKARQDQIRNADINLFGQDFVIQRVLEWPLPIIAVKARPNFYRAADIQLFGQDFIIARILEYPLPIIYPKARKDQVRSSDIILIGQDRIYGSAGEAPSYDYPNPRINPKKRQDQASSPNHPLNFLISFIVNYDWPNPLRPKRRQQSDSVGTNLNLNFLQAFFAQFDWPNPLRRTSRIQGDSVGTNLNINFLQAFFAQFDWPNPIRIVRRETGSVQRGILESLPIGLILDWIVPSRRKARDVGFVQNKTSEPVVTTPTAQTDWPVPRGKKRTIDQITSGTQSQNPPFFGFARVVTFLPDVAGAAVTIIKAVSLPITNLFRRSTPDSETQNIPTFNPSETTTFRDSSPDSTTNNMGVHFRP